MTVPGGGGGVAVSSREFLQVAVVVLVAGSRGSGER